MTTSEATGLVAMALAAYPQQASKLSDSAVRAMNAIWIDIFGEFDYGTAKAALMVHVRKNKYMPSPAELLEVMASHSASHRSGLDAWGDVLAEVRRCGAYRTPSFADPHVAEAVRAIGWQTLCASDNQVADRAHFAKLYESAAASARVARQVGDAAKALQSSAHHALVGSVVKALDARKS